MAAGGMHLIGRVSASAVANESTNSFMNFDFSLVKLNAPTELMPLGECLSNKRREKAESGPIHILARRLGALFDGLVEETPNLLRAYGVRASDIAKSVSESSTNSGRSKYGVFTNDAGVDGTTIWAAATSGPTALRLHLLACMLARLWSPQEATAIWVELVQERQRELRSESERNGFITSPAHAAAHIPIEEYQLSEWDASARAWILSADKAMQLQQTQAMLIINNLSLNVDSNNEPVYKSVISVWRRGMLAMEKLVGGTGQSVESGAVLLGLSAWHLYPDLLVLGVKSVEIYQKDELVGQGGLLTVGLSTATSDAEGIHWSLPLASLRYYGGPTYTRRTTRQDSTRLSVPQMQLVAMGALLAHWNNTITPDDFSKFILLLWKLFKAVEEHPEYNKELESSVGLKYLNINPILMVLEGLIHGATEFIAHAQDAAQRRLALQLLAYGKRHGQRWLGLPRAGEPPIPNLFGLKEFSTIIPLLHPQPRVALLLDMIKKLKLAKPTRVLIKDTSVPELDKFDTSIKSEFAIYTAVDDSIQLPPESRISLVFHEDLGLVQFLIISVLRNPTCPLVYSDALPYAHGQVIPRASLELDIQQIFKALEGALSEMEGLKLTNLVRLTTHLNRIFRVESFGESLTALGALSGLYTRYLPDATISMASTNMPLKEAKWYSRFLTLSRSSQSAVRLPGLLRPSIRKQLTLNPLDRLEMFACILQMESGTINAEPASLSNVFAISSGNSLFVAGQLLEDPHVILPRDSVAHIVGNIGKAGIALLIQPNQPRIREVELGEWEVIVHAPFDGEKQTGLFDSTSMHLSPTGYELNYDTGTQGLRGRQAFFVETRISVHDRGKWVADVDPLAAFHSRHLQIYTPEEEPCSCIDKKVPPDGSMISIDCWEELLDLPKENEVGVVRAAGSWMARIAAAAIAVQIGDCVVLPVSQKEEFCWSCFNSWRTPAQRSTKYLDLSSVPLKSVVFIW